MITTQDILDEYMEAMHATTRQYEAQLHTAGRQYMQDDRGARLPAKQENALLTPNKKQERKAAA